MVVRDTQGSMTLVREHVLPVESVTGKLSGLHVSLWSPAEQDRLPAFAGPTTQAAEAMMLLTSRQLEIARLYASGMTSAEVASGAGVSWRTARSHLEEIYARLDVHSRAQLALLLARANEV